MLVVMHWPLLAGVRTVNNSHVEASLGEALLMLIISALRHTPMIGTNTVTDWFWVLPDLST